MKVLNGQMERFSINPPRPQNNYLHHPQKQMSSTFANKTLTLLLKQDKRFFFVRVNFYVFLSCYVEPRDRYYHFYTSLSYPYDLRIQIQDPICRLQSTKFKKKKSILMMKGVDNTGFYVSSDEGPLSSMLPEK